MTATLSQWTHPKTGERRVYINGGMLDQGDKLYLTAGDQLTQYIPHLTAAYLPAYAGRVGGSTHKLDIAYALAERAIKAAGLAGNASFDEIWAAARR